MSARKMAIVTLVLAVLIPLALISCVPAVETCDTPQISITSFVGGTLTGTVCGMDPETMVLVVYVEIDYGNGVKQSWIKPFANDPFTDVSSSGDWKCNIMTGGIDWSAQRACAYIVSKRDASGNLYEPDLHLPPVYIASACATRGPQSPP